MRKTATGGLKDRIVKGYGAIWASRNDHGEQFVKGAFGKSISELGPDSNANYQIKFRDRHGQALALFSVLKEDDIGLYFETKPLDKIRVADELLVQLESGTINNFSIGFRHIWDRIEWDDETDTLINLEAKLMEISAVDIPSDKGTHQVRSIEDNQYLMEEVEDFICALPKTHQLDARKIITRCMSLGNTDAPLETRSRAPIISAPAETELDFDFLIKNFKLSN